jgi:uncharacterized protein YjiS (DUF1127 family)
MLTELEVVLRKLCQFFAKWRRRRKEMEVLAALDDWQLRDIGIDPYNVDRRDHTMFLRKLEDWFRFPHW